MFKTVLATARANTADFVCYKSGPSASLCIIDVATGDVVANASPLARDLIAAGVSARKQSFLDYDRGFFSCGTLQQMAVNLLIQPEHLA